MQGISNSMIINILLAWNSETAHSGWARRINLQWLEWTGGETNSPDYIHGGTTYLRLVKLSMVLFSR